MLFMFCISNFPYLLLKVFCLENIYPPVCMTEPITVFLIPTMLKD